MKILSRRSGFSLIELLTVIAIIAILAAIIFPVMSSVKEKARQNQCMTNLAQIQMGIQMFKQDNRKYPALLGAEVETDGSGQVKPFENCTDSKYLFKEYVKNFQLFHCPSSKVTNSKDYAEYQPGLNAPNVKVYAYDSYDYGLFDLAGTRQGDHMVYSNPQPHYVLSWAESVDAIANGNLKAYPPSEVSSSDAGAAQIDYERQLKFKTPPADTIVTWCSVHEGGDLSGQALVIFLDGHADRFPAKEMEECKWRLRQKKS